MEDLRLVRGLKPIVINPRAEACENEINLCLSRLLYGCAEHSKKEARDSVSASI